MAATPSGRWDCFCVKSTVSYAGGEGAKNKKTLSRVTARLHEDAAVL